MHSIQILFIISSLIAVSAGIPQMVKLIRTKSTNDFNLGTWAMWVGTQSVSTLYAISISDILLMTINACWVLFYLTMASLIIKYSTRPHMGIPKFSLRAFRVKPVPVARRIDITKPKESYAES